MHLGIVLEGDIPNMIDAYLILCERSLKFYECSYRIVWTPPPITKVIVVVPAIKDVEETGSLPG